MISRLFDHLLFLLFNAAGEGAARGFSCARWPWLARLFPGRPGHTPAPSRVAIPPLADAPVVLGETIPSAREALRQGRGGAAAPLLLPVDLRRRHVYVLGATGTGKTNLLVQMFDADVQAGRAVCLLDARGDLVDRVLARLAASHAPEDLAARLLLIDLRGGGLGESGLSTKEEAIVGFNPLAEAGGDPYTRAFFVLDVLRQQLGAVLGVQTEETLRNCLLALALTNTPGSLLEIEPMLTRPRFRRSVLESISDRSVLRFFERFDALAEAQRLQWTTPVLNKITPWLARPSLKALLGQPEAVSLRALLDARPNAIVLVCLGADELFQAAHLIGGLIVSAVASAVMRTDRPAEARHPLFLYLDEFENFGGTGEQFEAILSEGRRFGLGLTLSHQASGQLSPRLRSLIRNVVATQIFFATGGLDADTLAGEIPTEEPKAVLRNLLISQPVGEALVLRRGHPFTRLRTRLAPDPNIAPGAVANLRRAVLSAWGRPRAEVWAALAARESAWDSAAETRGGSMPVEEKAERSPRREKLSLARRTAFKATEAATSKSAESSPDEVQVGEIEVRDYPPGEGAGE